MSEIAQQERTILCFGDSNTWGFVPGGLGARFPRDIRWPGILQSELGGGYRIIEEGLNGRTTVLDNPIVPYRNGRHYLIPCLESHQPLDLVVIFLGTNDLSDRYAMQPLDIARGVAALAAHAMTSQAGVGLAPPAVLLLGLPRLGESRELAATMAGATEKATALPGCFERAAAEAGAPLLELSEIVAYSNIDGIHLDADGHQRVGLAVAAAVRRLLP